MSVQRAYQYTNTVSAQQSAAKRYVFLLLNDFSQISFSCALEALVLSNGYNERTYYSWIILSEDGQPVVGSSGMSINVDGGLQPVDRRDTIVVCGGKDIAANSTLKVLNWLRRESRKGVSCGSVSSATYTLAMAGLLTDKTATTHWENHTAFAEVFPEIDLGKTIYSVEKNGFTCAGGASSMDLMLHLIAQDYDQTLANWVADRMVYTTPRTTSHSQRLSIQCHAGVRHKKLSEAIEIMSQNIEDPQPSSSIASQVGISTRQLERLFRKYLNVSPKSYSVKLRLEKARELLLQTDLSVIEVCFSCGFNSASTFSKTYRRQFGVSPSFENASRGTVKFTGKLAPQSPPRV